MTKLLTYIEIDVDFCSLTYGTLPCTASIPATGSRKCFNSISTCQDRVNFTNDPVTLRYAKPCDYLPKTIDCIPSIQEVSFQPATISLGENLGQRATLTVVFTDHPWNDRGPGYDKYVTERPYDPQTLGTYWGKFRARQPYLRGRPIRLIRGVLGEMLSDMDTRHYVLESFEGPDPQTGNYTLIAKDVLKFADDDRAQAPIMSNGFLAGSIDNDDTALTLNPVGIGNLEYPASGVITIGGKECCTFTRSGDSMTIVRGQYGTQPQAHDAGDRVQLTLRYNGNDPVDVIYELLTTYAGVDPAYINLAEWQAESDANLSTLYASTITEPTSVKTLVSEIVQEAALALWWDDLAARLRIQVLREIATNAATFDADNIVEGSLRISEQPDKRISEQWTYFGQRNPTQTVSDEDNYRAVALDLDLQRTTDYGSAAVSKITGRFLATRNAAERLNAIRLSRFRDPPRKFSFAVFRDQPVTLAGGYRLSWWGNQDPTGAETDAPIQITRMRVEPDFTYVEAEEMLASGVFVVTQMVFLTTTGSVLSWQVPASWNYLDNRIECIGGGAGGHYNGAAGGSGGGAGGYSAIVNQILTPGAFISYRVGSGGNGAANGGFPAAAAGGDTWFNGASFGAAALGARGGAVGLATDVGGIGGQAASGIGTIKFSGGDGGSGAPRGTSRAGGGGGGGAAGPNGDGGNGGAGTNVDQDGGGGGGGADGGADGTPADGTNGGAGGHNRYNFGGGSLSSPDGQQGGGGRGGDRDTENAGRGGDGEQMWTQTISPIIAAGPGGGGGGGGSFCAANHAGNYGGAGGGTGGSAGPAGNGAPGIIVISWREA